MKKVIDKNGDEIKSEITLSVGEVINSELLARKMPKKDFAKLIGIKASNLSEVLKGKRTISNELALKIEFHLGIRAEYFLELQMNQLLSELRSSTSKSV